MRRMVPAAFRRCLPLVLLLLAATLAGCAAKATPAATAPPAPRTTAAPAAGTPNVVALAAHPRGPLASDLDPLFGTPALSTAVWSVLVQSLDTGEVLYRLNPDTLVMPASNQKIVSTAVAAARLGWDFRFETRLERAATVEGGTLRGDLFVVGTGDPTINAREGRDQSVFDELAAGLKAAGITRVDGRIVGDDNAFDDQRFGYGWQWDDFAFGYSAPVGPLQVHMNTVEVTIAPAATEGAPAVVTLRPDVGEFVVVNRVVTGPAGSEARAGVGRYPARRELVVEGVVPAGGKPVVRTAAIDNPTAYFAAVLKQALVARGITVTGGAVDIDDLPADDAATPPAVPSASVPPPAADTAPRPAAPSPAPAPRTVIARVTSPPLSEFAKTLMKISQNLYAETALRALSLSPGPATVEASQKVVEQVLSRWGIAPRTYITADGSGLSRNNYVNASMIVAILRAVARDPQLFEPFLATMPVAGEDGTLAGRMKGTRAAGNVKAKTGTIANVRSLSGYLTTAAGERIVFSMVANNFTTPSAVVDAAVEGALERVIAAPRPPR